MPAASRPASRPAPALSIPPLLTRLLAPKEGPISSGLRAGMSPEAVNTRFVASSNAAALSEASNGPLPGKAAKLATKALSFAWMWIQMIVLKLVEPLLHHAAASVLDPVGTRNYFLHAAHQLAQNSKICNLCF